MKPKHSLWGLSFLFPFFPGCEGKREKEAEFPYMIHLPILQTMKLDKGILLVLTQGKRSIRIPVKICWLLSGDSRHLRSSLLSLVMLIPGTGPSLPPARAQSLLSSAAWLTTLRGTELHSCILGKLTVSISLPFLSSTSVWLNSLWVFDNRGGCLLTIQLTNLWGQLNDSAVSYAWQTISELLTTNSMELYIIFLVSTGRGGRRSGVMDSGQGLESHGLGFYSKNEIRWYMMMS